MENSSNDSGSAFDSPMQARTATRDIFGKLDDSIPEVRVPHQVLLDAQARAAELGLDLSAFLRENLYSTLYGPEHVGMLYQERSRRVLGNARRDDSASPTSAVPSFLRSSR